jgi:hypothetical protein
MAHSDSSQEHEANDYEPVEYEFRFPPIAPEGDGCMPISAVLHWIACKGCIDVPDTPDIRANAGAQYQAAGMLFSEKASSQRLRVVGINRNQESEPIDCSQFVHVRWSFIFNDIDLFSNCFAGDARIVILGDDQYWIGRETEPRWTNLQVFKEDIRREWPFGEVDGSKQPSNAERAAAKESAKTDIKKIMAASPMVKTIELEILKENWLEGPSKIENLSGRGIEGAWHDALDDLKFPKDSPWRRRGPRKK